MSKRKIYYLTLFTSVFIVSAATILLYRSGIHQSGLNGDAGNTMANDASAWTMMAGTEQANNGEEDVTSNEGSNEGSDEGSDEDEYVTPVLQDVVVPSDDIESLLSISVPVMGRKILRFAI